MQDNVAFQTIRRLSQKRERTRFVSFARTMAGIPRQHEYSAASNCVNNPSCLKFRGLALGHPCTCSIQPKSLGTWIHHQLQFSSAIASDIIAASSLPPRSLRSPPGLEINRSKSKNKPHDGSLECVFSFQISLLSQCYRYCCTCTELTHSR